MIKWMISILIFGLLFGSCSATEDKISQVWEPYDDVYSNHTVNIGAEIIQSNSIIPTGVEGIITEDWVINDGKYYFLNRRQSNKGFGRIAVHMITYIDLETGVSNIICPDPLCDHEEDGDCKYTGFQDMYFSEPGVFYTMRVKSPDGIKRKRSVMSICKVNLNLDTVEEIYESSVFTTSLIGIHENKLYFEETHQETVEKRTIVKNRLFCIDTITDEVEDLGYLSEQFSSSSFYGFVEDDLYYYSNGWLMKTDLNFENQTALIDKQGCYMDQLFFDTNTDEIYYSLIDEDELKGGVYVYRNGVSERVVLPDENIYAFTLTNDKIYYSTYNPIYYGVSAAPGNPPVYDYSGGKIYMVDRENPTKAELVYDCTGEYVVTMAGVLNYSVFSDNLYFSECEIINETITLQDGSELECTYFSSAINLSKIRIDLATGELTRYQFD